MSYYFNGPWSDYASGSTAGITGNILRPRISVKGATYPIGYAGDIRAGTALNTSTSKGGVGVVTGGNMTIACWSMRKVWTTSSVGSCVCVSFEQDILTSTGVTYAYCELGWAHTSTLGPASGANVLRPRIRLRRSSTQLSGTGPSVFGHIGPTASSGFTGVSANSWVHMAGVVFRGITNSWRYVNLYVNGVVGQTNGAVAAPETFLGASGELNRTTIGGTKTVSIAGSGGAAGCENNFKGFVAEVAIWDVALLAEEIEALADGIPANNIRPHNLRLYAPLIRDLNTVVGNYTLSAEHGLTG